MEKSLKKIRKKQEACFGKDLQIMRNSFFRPNTYTHFKTGIILYQKIDLICKSSKFKKIVFKEFKEEMESKKLLPKKTFNKVNDSILKNRTLIQRISNNFFHL